MRGLHNKVALVTGGASGLGKTIAKRLRAEGAIVVITDTRADIGRTTADECDFIFLQQDVCDEAQWSAVVGELENRCDKLNILVNNAGVLGPMDASTPENTRVADWRTVFSVNVEGVLWGCRAAISAMRKTGGGAIINMSSMTALRASPRALAYGASKAAVRQLTKSVAQYCAEERLNIRCNSVHPGIVRTALWENFAEGISRSRGISLDDFIEETTARIPLGDFTLPEDVAAIVSFLASDDARHITGEKLIVDGGIVNCDTYRMMPRSAALNGQTSTSKSEGI